MPYKEHPKSTGIDDSQKIWRFMDFYKFVWLLEYSALFFSRCDKLGDDYFEGFYPNQKLKWNILDLNLKGAPLELEINQDITNKYGHQLKNQELDEFSENSLRDIAKKQRQSAFANCWYQNDYESDSLWKVYSQSNGIVIQSTVGRLKSAINFAEQPVYIFKIKYIDYDSETVHPDDLGLSFSALLHKRKQYESERELRALIFFLPTYDILLKYKDIVGIQVCINLDTLIENIYSRNNNSSFLNLVNKLLVRHNLAKEVKASKLSERPF